MQHVRWVVLMSTVSVNAIATISLNTAIRCMDSVGQAVTPAGPVHTVKVVAVMITMSLLL